jgi:hypothetical protein
VGGKRDIFDLTPDTLVSSAKLMLSVHLNVPADRLTFVHSAEILPDHISLGSLDFTHRNFISVTIEKRPPRCPVSLSSTEPWLPERKRSPPQTAALRAQSAHLLLYILNRHLTELTEALNRAVETESDTVDRFLAELTSDDFLALERVMTTNVPLDIAIPIFVRHGKDVYPTIEQINRMYGNH